MLVRFKKQIRADGSDRGVAAWLPRPFLFWAEDLTPMACLKVLTSAVSQDRDLETSAEIHSCRTSTRKRRPDVIEVAAFSLLPQ